ncbi:hypothetical protein M9H77_02944 [Catharanthus roseus]|uniref:Uncharacterized protein n=1 Tax=Catharanthus roseus TaxID=4058 RepID=A0ACC0CAC4_CATRO|nr:hypothetical protein M9H77_02944 [Catharanthus roseus]
MAPKKSTTSSSKSKRAQIDDFMPDPAKPAIPPYLKRLCTASWKWITDREHLKLLVKKLIDAPVIEHLGLNTLFGGLGFFLGIRDVGNTITIDSNKKTIDEDPKRNYDTTYDHLEIWHIWVIADWDEAKKVWIPQAKEDRLRNATFQFSFDKENLNNRYCSVLLTTNDNKSEDDESYDLSAEDAPPTFLAAPPNLRYPWGPAGRDSGINPSLYGRVLPDEEDERKKQKMEKIKPPARGRRPSTEVGPKRQCQQKPTTNGRLDQQDVDPTADGRARPTHQQRS